MEPLGMGAERRAFFRERGYLVLEGLFTEAQVARFAAGFDRDRSAWGPYLWKPLPSAHQTVNCDALVSWPEVDEIVRQPEVLATVEGLLGGPSCLSEVCLRHMEPYQGEMRQHWHRDRPHWQEHPLRTAYIHALVYLTDVDEQSHCFSISPEAADDPILERDEQLRQRGCVDLHGRAGTVVLFNLSVLHAATVRPTRRQRKSVQTYYGLRHRPYLSDHSLVPARLWRDHPDPEVRAFYGVLNRKSQTYAAAFGAAP